ncbi:MAG: hypothetical protein WBA89_05145 [Microcoleus sp.]|uniref:hypothetical protein n=1 Tax=Microcoleus sp. TaxID=44472 RepID=UPI003C795258
MTQYKYLTASAGEYKDIALNLAVNNPDNALLNRWFATKTLVVKSGLPVPKLGPV